MIEGLVLRIEALEWRVECLGFRTEVAGLTTRSLILVARDRKKSSRHKSSRKVCFHLTRCIYQLVLESQLPRKTVNLMV
jgi:hypothetical protein